MLNIIYNKFVNSDKLEGNVMTELKSLVEPGVVQGVINQGQVLGLAMGFQHPNGSFEVTKAFITSDTNWGKILDVLTRFTMMGLYEIGSKEIRLLPQTLHSTLMEWFGHTGHGGMKEFLALLQEKQKGGSVGIFAVIVTPCHITDNNGFSALALPQLEA